MHNNPSRKRVNFAIKNSLQKTMSHGREVSQRQMSRNKLKILNTYRTHELDKVTLTLTS